LNFYSARGLLGRAGSFCGQFLAHHGENKCARSKVLTMYRWNRRLNVRAAHELQGNILLARLERQTGSKDASVEDVVTQGFFLHFVFNQSQRSVGGSEMTEAKLYEGETPIGVRARKLEVKRIDLCAGYPDQFRGPPVVGPESGHVGIDGNQRTARPGILNLWQRVHRLVHGDPIRKPFCESATNDFRDRISHQVKRGRISAFGEPSNDPTRVGYFALYRRQYPSVEGVCLIIIVGRGLIRESVRLLGVPEVRVDVGALSDDRVRF
jgi:hypothetical protein